MTFISDLSKIVIAYPTNDLSLNFTYVLREYCLLFYKRRRLSVLSAIIFFGGSARTYIFCWVQIDLYDFQTSSYLRHNEYKQQIMEKPVY